MRRQDFFYNLPENLIAQSPLKDRTSSKLMVLDKNTGQIEHKYFYNVIDYLEKGDCLVLNNTKVLPARLLGQREKTGGKIEVLLLKRIDKDQWETLVNPGKKAKIGEKLEFGDGLLKAKVIDIIEDGKRVIEFDYEGIFEEILDQLGEMPLPPYITEKLEDRNRYQTVYAKVEGSAAAPTAGLHFTKDIMDSIKEKGIYIAYVTLHVGLGTFRPVKVDEILDHIMHSEYYHLRQSESDIINNCRNSGGKIVAVGTTSSRVLESCTNDKGLLVPAFGETNIFIYPGYEFKMVDKLITNFHLPESTLLMLVSALSSKEKILHAYEEAIKNEYRFFSFGDAMIIK